MPNPVNTPLQDVNISGIVRLPSPQDLKAAFPLSEASLRTVAETRETVKAILQRKDPRFLVVVGPCSIHNAEGALEYARRLRALQKDVEKEFFLLMRVYFEKPRTTIGWKGLISDPFLDGSCDMEAGLRLARKLLSQITEMGMGAATEFLDPIVPQYIADLVSWAAIGARTTESQTHRQMASGLSMPIGFKNGTDGSLQVAVDAMDAARHSHNFLGIDAEGRTATVLTKGNPWGHIILRGGNKRTNYDPKSLAEAATRMQAAGLPATLLVDCSHANSEKKPERQEIVWQSILDQRADGNAALLGAMLESNLEEGRQAFPNPGGAIRPGQSITDSCISWETTEKLLRTGAERLRAHQAAMAAA